jgi:hypothetical protein
MIEFVSWIGVVFIALFAVAGFTGVVVTSVMTVVRSLRHRDTPVATAVEAPSYISAA